MEERGHSPPRKSNLWGQVQPQRRPWPGVCAPPAPLGVRHLSPREGGAGWRGSSAFRPGHFSLAPAGGGNVGTMEATGTKTGKGNQPAGDLLFGTKGREPRDGNQGTGTKGREPRDGTKGREPRDRNRTRAFFCHPDTVDGAHAKGNQLGAQVLSYCSGGIRGPGTQRNYAIWDSRQPHLVTERTAERPKTRHHPPPSWCRELQIREKAELQLGWMKV